MIQVEKVHTLDNYKLELRFNDGTAGIVDVSSFVGIGVFAAWQDERFFQTVEIGESGELKWGEDIDLCPDALYLNLTGKSVEELYPQLAEEVSYA